MITVSEAYQIIQSKIRDYGTLQIPFELSTGRIIAEDVYADRDMPPFDRATMDGIAINYEAIKKGIKNFTIIGTQAAGEEPIKIFNISECIEIMTGAALNSTVDTIIRYEDIFIDNNTATIQIQNVKQEQNIHKKGIDKKEGQLLIAANQIINVPLISILSSIGKKKVLIKKLPTVIIISSGDELIDVEEIPGPFQIRKSNNYTIKAALEKYHIIADMVHIPDNPHKIKETILECLNKYDVILISGGVSKGKFDHIPKVMEEIGIDKLFHNVNQKPGKPFFFGEYNATNLIFAFPGNPVSTFFCVVRYFLPWLHSTTGLTQKPATFAQLQQPIRFSPPMQYFVPVELSLNENAQLMAYPFEGNGSGDFSNLLKSNAFMELPAEQNNFTEGEFFRVWPFSSIL